MAGHSPAGPEPYDLRRWPDTAREAPVLHLFVSLHLFVLLLV